MTEAKLCPALVAIELAEEMLSKYSALHTDPKAASGRLALMREVYDRLHAVLPCSPTPGYDGQLVCNLVAVANEVYNYALAPSAQHAWALPLDVIATGQAAEAPGAFL